MSLPHIFLQFIFVQRKDNRGLFLNLREWKCVCHAPNPIPEFVTMIDMLISSLNLILTKANLTFTKILQKLPSFLSFLFLYFLR